MWLGLACVEVCPSPNVQLYVNGWPSGSLDPELEKPTSSGAAPDVGVAAAAATGGWLLGAPPAALLFEAAALLRWSSLPFRDLEPGWPTAVERRLDLALERAARHLDVHAHPRVAELGRLGAYGPGHRALTIAEGRRLPPVRRGASERLQAWVVTGPLGHLWSALADIVVLLARYSRERVLRWRMPPP